MLACMDAGVSCRRCVTALEMGGGDCNIHHTSQLDIRDGLFGGLGFAFAFAFAFATWCLGMRVRIRITVAPYVCECLQVVVVSCVKGMLDSRLSRVM